MLQRNECSFLCASLEIWHGGEGKRFLSLGGAISKRLKKVL
jgi:hypothetical protein